MEKEGSNWLKPGAPGKNCIHFGPRSVGSFSVQLNKHQQYAIEVCFLSSSVERRTKVT